MTPPRDHGGGLDAAMAQYGGTRDAWIDLSTGINPTPYPLPDLSPTAWYALPDRSAIGDLEAAARAFWGVPRDLEVVAAGGASALIAAMPRVLDGKTFCIPSPTYNEHLAAFEASGWSAAEDADVTVLVHPNNPDGRFWDQTDRAGQRIIDESFCDVAPERSFVQGYSATQTHSENENRTVFYAKNPTRAPVILKSFGKFWGLAGLRLGFAICSGGIATKLRDQLGPWAVSGPACQIGTEALKDIEWASETRTRLRTAAQSLDNLLRAAGLEPASGTDLFRLVPSKNAKATQDHLARHQILTRIFPYSKTWVRFGLPGPQDHWDRLKTALNTHP